MKHKHLILLLTLISLSTFSLYGCSSKETTEPEAQEMTEDIETPPADEENQEYMESSEVTPLDEIQGEGAPDQTVPDFEESEFSNLNTKHTIKDLSGNDIGTLEISEPTEFHDRDANNPSQPEKVIVMDYSYTNTSSPFLLIDDMSFKLIVNDAVCTPYYTSLTKGADLIEEGGSCSAQLAYEVPANATEGTLIYLKDNGEAELTFKLEF